MATPVTKLPVKRPPTAQAAVGDVVFSTTQDPELQAVHAGVQLVTGAADTGKALAVHEHRQAPRQKTRFTPLYLITSTNKHDAKLK